MKLKTRDNFILDVQHNKFSDKQCIIFAHGMTVNKNDEGVFVRSAQILNKLGFSTILFDFRAHGKSSGDSIKDFTISGNLVDLNTVVSFAKDEGYDFIGLAGASFGGGISALFAGEHPHIIKKLFLANPVLDYEKNILNPTSPWGKKNFSLEKCKKDGFLEVGSRKFKIGPAFFDHMSDYDPCFALNMYKNPMLIVQGDRDSKVPIENTKEYYSHIKRANTKLVIIKGSEHGFHEEPFETEVTDMIVTFFKSFLSA